MKLVLTILPSELLGQLFEGLDERHLAGVTVSQAQGLGPTRGTGYGEVELRRRLRLEMVCHDEEVEGLLLRIQKTFHADARAHIRIVVSPVDDMMILKAGQRDPPALGPSGEWCGKATCA